jgi:type II secretion system protein J
MTARCRRAHRAGFTLLEMLVTVMITAVLVTGVFTMYAQLTEAGQRAMQRTRESRSAAALLDRIAHDLETAFLIIKADDVDPLEHPWVFVAERRRGQSGSDRVKFNTLTHRVRGTKQHASDVATMAYILEGDEDGGFELLRWVETVRPDGLERNFPRADDPGIAVVGGSLASFALRFMTADGDWVDDWDSSLVVRSGHLPLAVEIELSMYPEFEPDEDDAFEEEAELTLYSRRVVLPQRPLAFETLAGLGDLALDSGADGDQDGDGIPDSEDPDYKPENCALTYGQCIARQDPEAMAALPAEVRAGLNALRSNICFVQGDTTLNVPDLSRCQ